MYLGSRELVARRGVVEPLRGVIYIDSKIFSGYKIYGQITLTFRYGREDEEVMGLKFCNEAVISLKQLWPKIHVDINRDENTPLQVIFFFELKIQIFSDVFEARFKKCYGDHIGYSLFKRITFVK